MDTMAEIIEEMDRGIALLERVKMTALRLRLQQKGKVPKGYSPPPEDYVEKLEKLKGG